MVKSKKYDDQLTVYLSGEIDHCSADRLRKEIESLLADARIRRLTLDFEQVSFMDSSGVGMIIGRYRTMRERGGTMTACGLHPPVEKLFHMAGLHRIIAQENAGRQEET